MSLDITRVQTADEMIAEKARRTNFWRDALCYAHKQKASDIHIEPMGYGFQVRMRINGELSLYQSLDYQKHSSDYVQSLIQTLKTVARLDTSTRSRRQDGGFRLNLTRSSYRVCVSSGFGYGEGMVLRIAREDEIPSLDSLGLNPKARKDFEWACKQMQGLILVTGPKIGRAHV